MRKHICAYECARTKIYIAANHSQILLRFYCFANSQLNPIILQNSFLLPRNSYSYDYVNFIPRTLQTSFLCVLGQLRSRIFTYFSFTCVNFANIILASSSNSPPQFRKLRLCNFASITLPTPRLHTLKLHQTVPVTLRNKFL